MKPIILLGEAWGENEARHRKAFIGAAGAELIKMCAEAGLLVWSPEDQALYRRYWQANDPLALDMLWGRHPNLYRANVFNQRPLGNKILNFCGGKEDAIKGYPPLAKSKFVRREFIPELERLGDEITSVDPNLIVCLGNTALWALAGNTGISKLRGTTRLSTHTVSDYKLLPTYHPSAILYMWDNRSVTVADLMKAKREAEYPDLRRPARDIWIEPTIEDLHVFEQQYIRGCKLLSIDIETAGRYVTCIGFCPDPNIALVVPFVDPRRKNRAYWPDANVEAEAWRWVARILADHKIKKLFQNGAYDIAFLLRSMKLPTYGAEHDTMLLQHALQPEMLKGLGFLGSLYSDEGAWKTERKVATIKRDD